MKQKSNRYKKLGKKDYSQLLTFKEICKVFGVSTKLFNNARQS